MPLAMSKYKTINRRAFISRSLLQTLYDASMQVTAGGGS